jgi:hypothetical protein
MKGGEREREGGGGGGGGGVLLSLLINAMFLLEEPKTSCLKVFKDNMTCSNEYIVLAKQIKEK